MKLDLKKVLRDVKCALGRHAWKRTTTGADYMAGFHTRGCDHCRASQVFASDLGRWLDNTK